MSKMSLNGSWQVREAPRGSAKRRVHWIAATVPGCVQTDLMNAGRMPDPHIGRNELDTFWVDETSWEYVRTFRATRTQCAAALQHLVFEGLDTVGEVHLNGRLLGRTDNMFRRWRFDVAGRLREGDNELRVVFHPAVKHGQAMAAKSKSVCNRLMERLWQDRPPRPAYRAFVRKAQYQFGWDWGLMQITCGIWQPCYLETSDAAVFEYVTTQQKHAKDRVTVEVTARLLAGRAGRGVLRVILDGQTVETRASVRKGRSVVKASVTVRDPRLWWPAGQGKQELYDLAVEWVPEGEAQAADRYETKLGLRRVELVQDKDAIGSTFKFRINGRDVYCKGANWIPDDVFPTRTTRARLERLLADAVAANMNMLRVWGGGIYASDDFLEICDRLGIMLWHDFMFACAAYPEDQWFFDSVEAEMRHQMRRLMNHPSIVLWCGNNENQTAVDVWWREDPQVARMRKAYDKLTFGVQERVVLDEDPGRPWWSSSPAGYPRDGVYPYGWEKSGDMHYWKVWHGRMPFENYLTIRPRFNSEFGFQAFPSLETLRTVVGPKDLNVSSPVMEHHQRSGIGNSVITETLTREFRFPADFGDFCYLSQVNQGMAMKIGIEHWRRIKPYCMGTLYWQFNDDWPVASWAGIDWCLRWKALHYMARRFYAPLLGSVVDDEKNGLQLWATSDVAEPLSGTWQIEAWTYAGRRVWTRRGSFRLAENESRAIATLPKDMLLDLGGGRAGVFLTTTVRAGRYVSPNTHFFGPLKWADLPKSRIAVGIRPVKSARDGAAFELRLSSDAPAFHVELSTGKLGGRFSDNIFTLLPRRPVTVRFEPDLPTTVAALKKCLQVRSVRDTY